MMACCALVRAIHMPAQVQALGASFEQPADVLRPGARYHIPIYLRATGDNFQLALDQMIAGPSLIDWVAVEADVRPPDLAPGAGAALWGNFKAQVGATWGDYLRALGDQAAYLAQHGSLSTVRENGIATHYVHDPAGLVDVAAEYNNTGALAARYVHGLGLVARVSPSAGPAYYGYDGSGNTRQLTDAAGAIANRYDYTPFGLARQASETVPNPFRFVGRLGVMDDGNGLHFMRARFYDAGVGRLPVRTRSILWAVSICTTIRPTITNHT